MPQGRAAKKVEPGPAQPETRTAVVGDVTVTVQQPDPLQMAMVMRFLRRGSRLAEPDVDDPSSIAEYNTKVINLITKALDLMEAMIVSEEDKELVADEVIAGRVGMKELAKILSAFADEDGAEPKKAVKAVPRVRRT